MDAEVLAAVARWPNVPAVHGWLSLDRRGQWRLRGEPIGNAAIVAFIGRNYDHDAHGRWFFQNGPQRVFVDLDLAPWVLRLVPGGAVTHTGLRVAQCTDAAVLDDGHAVIATEHGAAAIDDRDAHQLAAALVDADGRRLRDEQALAWLEGDGAAWLDTGALGLRGGRVPVARIGAADLEARFGFVRTPR